MGRMGSNDLELRGRNVGPALPVHPHLDLDVVLVQSVLLRKVGVRLAVTWSRSAPDVKMGLEVEAISSVVGDGGLGVEHLLSE
jgi:hypothetical protein